ncbi:hypothetical protein [Streptomyces sp. NPDC004065]|uniref:hypothetical protein n=1 Tax=Streptomyces sp. NPDC004065 TaxID=3364689 RepID=UPI00384FB2B0
MVQALERAVLPAFHEEDAVCENLSGAAVCMEPDAELASASVSVGWRCRPDMLEAASDALTPPVTTRRPSGIRDIGLHMQSALVKILLSAGIIATPENDNVNPERVLVFGTMPPALRPVFVPPGTY